mmetsp:Transcript_4802/g.10304  ORF Transcript_4802/g.10304 Transcript_4802/m.10304 type:complete len:263 (+) Transcript_4802:114-902(+)
MALRSQSLRIARALTTELHPAAHRRSVSSAWLNHRPNCASSSARLGSVSHDTSVRSFSAKPEEAAEPQSPPSPPPPADEEAATKDSAEEGAVPVGDDAAGRGGEGEVTKLETQIKELKDNLLRSLAEQENTRRIARRDVANAKSFAIASFAKSLLDTSDNLSRALDAVPEELRHDHENHPVLANLYEGISMTDEGLTKAFAKNGLVKFGEKGEKFDPNLHEALFEYPDPEGEAGNVGQVMKVGFMLNERVVRPAEVGVVKAP